MKLFRYSFFSSILFISLSFHGQKPGLNFPEGEFGKDYNAVDENGERQGLWIRVYPNKNLYYKGQYVNHVPAGVWEFYYDTGELQSTVDHVRDTTENFAVFFDKGTQTKMSEGKYVSRMIDKKWTREKQGLWVFFNTNGIKIGEEFYLNNQLHGTCRYFYPGGKLYQVIEYKNGVKDGPCTEYYEDGTKKMECAYKNDNYDGPIKHYFSNGALQFTGQYVNGLKDGTWTMYTSGPKVEMIVSYAMGVEKKRIYMNGTFVEHYEDGIPRSEYSYENGKKDGPFEEWYDRGSFQLVPGSLNTGSGAPVMTEKLVGAQLSSKGDYLNGQLEGEVIFYNEDGSINRIEEWASGKLLKTRKAE